jgi:hypothetical protein
MKIPGYLLLCTLSGILSSAAAAGADELPVFRPGLWSFSVTVNHYGEKNPKVRTMTRCADPGEEIRKKWQSLAVQSCKFSPLAHTGNQYSYSSACSDRGRTVSTRSVIIADQDDAYRVDSESHTQTQANREVVLARRVGDCPPGGAPMPVRE